MKMKIGNCGFLVSASILATVACAGEKLYEVGDLTTSGGGGAGGSGGMSGSAGKPAKGGSGPIVITEAGAPAAGQPAMELPGDGGTAGDGFGGAPPADPCAAGSNLLANGSFDELTNGFPTGWKAYGNPAELVTFDAANGSDGGNSIKLALPESYEYWVQQRASSPCIEPGELVRVTGYYRTDLANPDIDVAVQVGDEQVPLDRPTIANEWLPFSVDVTAPSKAFNVRLWSIGPYDKQATTLWFDDISLVRVP